MRIDVSDPKYRLHAPDLESQHLALFQAINQLHDGMKNGTALKILGETFEQLITYAAVHFKNEETLMLHWRYPQLSQHRREHEYFLAQVNALQIHWQLDRRPPSIYQTMEFLHEWVTTHILTHDRDLDRWIVEQELSGQAATLSGPVE